MKASRGAWMTACSLATALVVVSVAAPSGSAQQKSGLGAAESGVGSAVANRELQGKGDSFPEGSDVCFLTKIDGGQTGDKVEHVWIRDGKEMWRTSLAVGGSPWRTWSCKTMHRGSAGPWIVEARAGDGKVVAKASFRCTAGS